MIAGVVVNISIGGLEMHRSPQAWIESQRHSCLSRCGVTLADPAGELHTLVRPGDHVSITYGYRDQEPATWQGTVEWMKPGTEDQAEIGAVGTEKPLAAARIVQAWANETPEAVIRYACGRAGLSIGRLDSPGIVFPRFVAMNISPWQIALQCAQSCRRSYGLDMSRWALWLGSGGVNWGDFDEPGNEVVVASAGLLISHQPASDQASLSGVEAFLIPGLGHSQKVRLVDERRGIDHEFRALKVRHEIGAENRTIIWYGAEHDRI